MLTIYNLLANIRLKVISWRVFESFYAAEKAIGIGLEGILNVINKERLTAGGFRWFLQNNPPEKEDLIITRSKTSASRFNEALWKRLGRPTINKKTPPPCMNLSIEDLPHEHWKPILGFERYYAISDYGRIKRLSTWTLTPSGRAFYLKDLIISQIILFKSDNTYSLYCLLHHKKETIQIEIIRLLYYSFVQEFNLKDRSLLVINENEPLWNTDLSKLSLHFSQYLLEEKKEEPILSKVRIVLNSKKIFNDSLWKKLGKPGIDKKNPPPIMDISLRDLPNENWKPLPGYERKYVISNKGRVKRLSGWSSGNQFFAEEQIISLNLMRQGKTHYLCFRLHYKENRSQMILHRSLYYCFLQEFDLSDKTLVVINENEPLWEVNLLKLSLHSIHSVHKRKINNKNSP